MLDADAIANPPARHEALQLLYQRELTAQLETDDESAVEPFVVSNYPEGVNDFELVGDALLDYATELVDGVTAHIEQIDAWISQTARNWTIERMPAIDRNIIRLACYEMAFADDIPVSVAINEAVELAKSYGGDDSPKFVNGVLGRIATMLEEEGAVGAATDEE